MKSNILLYGAGGIGKTSRAVEAAAYIYKTKGLKTRVVCADGGGSERAFDGLVEAGVAEVWSIDQWEDRGIFSILDQATKGYWPADLSNTASPLLPPVRVVKPCPHCGNDSGAKGFAMVAKCASCHTAFAAGQQIAAVSELVNGAQDVGLVVFEGMTSFGEMLLRALRKLNPEGGRFIEEKGEGGDSFKIAGGGKQHYLDAQNYLAQFVANCRKVPVDTVVWTALEVRGDDEGKPLYGPKGPGKALTTACIPWFTDVLHIDAVARRNAQGGVEKDKNGQEILDRKMFLAPHFPSDQPSFKFGAKTSAPFGGGMPSVIEPDMGLFFREMEKAKEVAKAKLLG